MRGTIVLDKYRLHTLLGSGGMAEVWSATNTFTEREVAIKFLGRSVLDHPEACARFLREARITGRVTHPNIIEVLDAGRTDDGRLFLVMELLTGLPLEVAIHRQTPRLSLHDFTLLVLDVARALAAAHRAGIVHRDLKPANIFLHQPKGGVVVPKLLDFGVARFIDEDPANLAITIPGTVLGSALYMSPEQARGEELDRRTDIFSFGSILFEALTGERAYEARNFSALLVTIATSPPKDVDRVAPSLPENLRRAVAACLVHRREDRVATFDEVVGLLERALPELAKSRERLPKPLYMGASVDPDATNALPVLSNVHATTFAEATTSPRARSASRASRASGPVAVALVVGVVAGAMLARTFAASTRSDQGGQPVSENAPASVAASASAVPAPVLTTPAMPAVVTDAPAPTPVLASPVAGPAARASGRVVPVEALPDARRAMGFVEVTSTGSACTVWIDGRERGATPYRSELAPGAHAIGCTKEGFARRGFVSVPENGTAAFHVDIAPAAEPSASEAPSDL